LSLFKQLDTGQVEQLVERVRSKVTDDVRSPVGWYRRLEKRHLWPVQQGKASCTVLPLILQPMQHSLETLQREKTLGVRGDGRRQNARINSKRVKTSDY